MSLESSHTARGSSPAAAATCLGTELSLRTATAQREHLKLLAAADGEVTLDGGRIEVVDTAGLQLLAALISALEVAGRPWTWQAASPPLRAAVVTLGLGTLMQLPPTERPA